MKDLVDNEWDLSLNEEKPFFIVYKSKKYRKPTEQDHLVYQIINEADIQGILCEFHLSIELMLEEESFLDAFYLLKRMEQLIQVISLLEKINF